MEYTLDLTVLKVIHRRNLALSTVAGNVFGFTESQSLSRLYMFLEHMMILEAAGFDFENNLERCKSIFAILIHQIWGIGYVPKDTFNRPIGIYADHVLSKLWTVLEQYRTSKNPNPYSIVELYKKHVTYQGDTVFKLVI